MSHTLVVETVHWERVTLSIVFRLEESELEYEDYEDYCDGAFGSASDIQLIYLQDGENFVEEVPFEVIDERRVKVEFNVTNFADRKFIPMGAWRFIAVSDDHQAPAVVDLSRLEELETYTRAYLYNNNRGVFTVQFGITDSDTPLFAMRAYGFTRGGKKQPKSKHPLAVANRLKNKVVGSARRRRVARQLYSAVRASHLLARKYDKDYKPRVLFASEMRTGIEGNLLAVRDRMVARGLDEQFEFRYSFRIPREATPMGFVRLITEIARADYLLIDDYFALLQFLDIDPDTRIIQVWHAGVGFKSVGYSRFGKFGSPAITNAHRKYTYAITGSTKLKHVYSEVFGIEEDAVIPTGLPRIDTFLDPDWQAEARERVYGEFPQLRGKRVILFAPTFRGRGVNDARYDYDHLDMDALYELCGEDTVVAFRMHHFVHDPVPIAPEQADRFVDVGAFRDGNALLLVSDVMVTDYSSIIYEFSLLRRPMVFYAYDKTVYSATRGFHHDYDESAPGKVVESFDELLAALRDEDFELEKTDAFREDNFDYFDTHASDRVIDWLILGDPPTAESEQS